MRQLPPDGLQNLGGNDLFGPRRINDVATVRLPGGDIEKRFAALLVGFELLLLETVRGDVASSASPPGALETRQRRQIEDKRAVGNDTIDRDALQRLDEFRLKIPGHALIDPRRIHEAIAKDHLAGHQSRPDDFLDVIIACRCEEDCLHAGSKGFGSTRQKHVTHSLGARRTARLPCQKHVMTAGTERLSKAADLRRLARALPAFKRYKQPSTGWQ